MDSKIDLSELVNNEIDFYAHCIVKFGVKGGYWEKVGRIADIGNTEKILFRNTNDCGLKRGQEPIKVSHKWFIWKINDEKFTFIGDLAGENRNAEIGVVFTAESILYRMQTGKQRIDYPD